MNSGTQIGPPGIIIRAQTESDFSAIVKIRNAERQRWGTLAVPYESVESWRQRWADKNPGRTELVACADGEAIGMAGIHRFSGRRDHAATIGIGIRDDWHAKGVGTALFAALTDLADNWLGLRRLALNVYTDNAPAIALYEKFGFLVEGTQVNEAYRDAAFVDSTLMARLRGHLPRDTSLYPPAATPAPAAPFTLRAAEPRDQDGVAELMRQPLVRHGTMQVPFARPDEQNKRLVTPATPDARAIVATSADQLVGIGLLEPNKGRRRHSGEITLLAVHDAWHGRGIGRALMTALLNLADNWLNLQRLGLGVLADNQPAMALYTSMGFKTEGIGRADIFRAGAFADTALMARLR